MSTSNKPTARQRPGSGKAADKEFIKKPWGNTALVSENSMGWKQEERMNPMMKQISINMTW
jgi:hypothetical protein